ncbi:MAG: tetratricopeptide repeat protein, partial [Treponema sp.]|nr:tetratricopeptide repeat protein [Treponema sp.]
MKKFARLVLALSLAAMVCPLWAQVKKTAVSLYNQAYAMQQREDYYGAIETYQEALQMNAQYGDAWYNLAVCTFCLGEYDLSVQYADTAAKYSRNLTQVQNLKGLALIALGKISEARTVFNGVLAKYPNDIDARFGLAEIDLYGGSLSAAEKRYLDALKRDANNRKALLSLALVTSEEGKDAVAERYVNQALEYHSSEAEVHYLAAYLAAKRGNLQEAERRARSAVQIRGSYDKAYELLSQILYSQGRYNEVIDLCEFRIGRNRNLSTAWY